LENDFSIVNLNMIRLRSAALTSKSETSLQNY